VSAATEKKRKQMKTKTAPAVGIQSEDSVCKSMHEQLVEKNNFSPKPESNQRPMDY
jgi:hypothetical protein